MCYTHVLVCYTHVVVCYTHMLVCYTHVVVCYTHVISCTCRSFIHMCTLCTVYLHPMYMYMCLFPPVLFSSSLLLSPSQGQALYLYGVSRSSQSWYFSSHIQPQQGECALGHHYSDQAHLKRFWLTSFPKYSTTCCRCTDPDLYL